MASTEIEQLQARIRALPNQAEGGDIVKALADIAEAMVAIDAKLAAVAEAVERLEE